MKLLPISPLESIGTSPVRDAPAFDFYPERWLVGVAGMSDAEQLSYLRLLCHQWLMDGLPAEVPALKRLGGSKGVTPAVLAKLPLQADGKRRNARLEIIRQEQRERIAKKSEQRRAAALKRWHPAAETVPAGAMHPPGGHVFENHAPGQQAQGGSTHLTPAAPGMRPHAARRCETAADELRTPCGSRCETPAAGMPTTHHPPPTPVPEAIHPPAGARVRPTLDQAREIAPEIGITPEQAETWWLAREASQWLRSSNGALMPVGDNWRADAKTFTQNALQRRPPHASHRPTPVRSDSANAPGRYA